MGVALYALSIALVVLSAVAIIAVVIWLTGDGGRIRREEVLDAQRRALTAERFIDRLKEIAWDHRDVRSGARHDSDRRDPTVRAKEPGASAGMKPRTLIALAAVAVLLPLGAITSCTSASTAADEIALHYEGGPLSSKRFKECVAPSARQYDGPGDQHFYYPANQRVFDFTGKEGSDAVPITVVSRDNVELSVPGSINFSLNTECEVLRRFHERIGNRYQAYMDDGKGGRLQSAGWVRMLNLYIGRAADTTMDRIAQQYTWRELYNNPAVKEKMEQEVNEQIADLVQRQTDGDDVFFQNFASLIQKPEPPDELKAAITQEQTKVAQANAARAEADAKRAQVAAEVAVAEQEARKVATRVRALGGTEAYLKERLIDRGGNPYQPTYGGGTLVPAPEPDATP